MYSVPLVLTLLFSLALPQQGRDTRPATVGTGRIAGTVVDAESGRPIRFAHVLLRSPQEERLGVTDGGGTFSFDRLPSGAYRLVIAKPGYLETVYGQTRPGTDTPGKQILLRDREPVARVVVPLSQGGAISGTIRDDRGDPVYGADVSVSRWVTSYGIRQLEELESARTDERGNYRISLLPPRDYVLSAAPPGYGLPDTEGSPSPFEFATAFHPGVSSAASAESIRLGLGETRSNIDLTLPLVAVGSVSGVVLDASGKPASGVEVALLSPREITNGETGRTTNTGADGRFLYEKVVPGAYVLIASTIPQNERISFPYSHARIVQGSGVYYPDPPTLKEVRVDREPASPATIHPPASAWSDVSVTGGGTSNVTLSMEPPRKLMGRLVLEGAARPPAMKEIRIEMSALRGPHGSGANISDDGTFEIDNLAPGRYAINVGGFAAPWSLSSVSVGGVEALDAFLEMPRDRDVRDVTVTLRDREAELSGSVSDAAGRPASERTVVVFPSDDRLWAGFMRVQAEFLPADGMFVFRNLRPGRYLLAVVDGVEAGEWLDPAFLRNLLTAAVPVTLGEGERKVQDLRVR